ncbi:MAG: hypothetical protein SWY16_03685 [Cyanobacteriota bacterium]|nr:hypothetical protein [Cyanobacteriota bacterium]
MISSSKTSPIESIENAVDAIITRSKAKPSPKDLVSLLLKIEKTAKSREDNYTLKRLVGDWRLCFITGTKKTRQQAGIALGAGRYLPKLVQIQLSYTPIAPEDDRVTDSTSSQSFETGWVKNQVKLGSLQLILTGPTKFLKKNNILAFDFTRITVRVFGARIYDGYIRGGSDREREFDGISVGKQAFFNYFWIGERAIAARGRGGGLALWVLDSQSA